MCRLPALRALRLREIETGEFLTVGQARGAYNYSEQPASMLSDCFSLALAHFESRWRTIAAREHPLPKFPKGGNTLFLVRSGARRGHDGAPTSQPKDSEFALKVQGCNEPSITRGGFPWLLPRAKSVPLPQGK